MTCEHRLTLGALFVLLVTGGLSAHVLSMSSGELRVEGRRAELEIRLPVYEVSHLDNPTQALLDSFEIHVESAPAQRSGGECAEDAELGAFVCKAEYLLPSEPEEIEIDCRLAETTVANHVHILRVVSGDNAEQKVFDYATSRETVRLEPLTPFEEFSQTALAGAKRVIGGPAQLLFLLALAVAARGRSELLAMGAAFLAAQAIGAVGLVQSGWEPPARFVESAGALTVAYLATEILLLPQAGARWLVAAGMGLFHGIYFGVFLRQSQMSAPAVLSGASAAEAMLLAVLGVLALRLAKDFGETLFRRVSAGLLLAIGIGWFAVRLWSV